jgi:transcriptional regulator with XRE-family HTH domain
MTQEKLASALGVTFQQVQKYEKGANRIGAGRLQLISRSLDVAPSFFYEGAPQGDGGVGFAERKLKGLAADFVTTAEGLQLNRAFARIEDPSIRKRIIDLVVALGATAGVNDAHDVPPEDAG